MAGITDAIKNDTQNMELVTSKLDAVYDCRKTLARTINRDVRRGTVARAAAKKQMALLSTLMEEDVSLAQKVLGELGERSSDFRVATKTARKSAATKSQRKKVRKAEKALQTNQAVYEKSDAKVARIQAKSEGEDFNLASLFRRLVLMLIA